MPNTKDVYLNVFKGRNGLFTLGETDTLGEAKGEAEALARLAGSKHVGRMRVTLEEGRWDD